jgi:hypothetical protein
VKGLLRSLRPLRYAPAVTRMLISCVAITLPLIPMTLTRTVKVPADSNVFDVWGPADSCTVPSLNRNWYLATCAEPRPPTVNVTGVPRAGFGGLAVSVSGSPPIVTLVFASWTLPVASVALTVTG